MAHVTIFIEFSTDPDKASSILKSLKPETDSIKSRRSKTSVERIDGDVTVKLEAEDITAARAAANTVIRLLNVSLATMEVLENG
ncbi:MAG: KEOPS complex subunit Pcc1 [Candidatus Caldarchaeum sp.]|jgi:tRNA threonylcarbamoyladenosine modification (KEOPS) complex  Pcc1 subunit